MYVYYTYERPQPGTQSAFGDSDILKIPQSWLHQETHFHMIEVPWFLFIFSCQNEMPWLKQRVELIVQVV